MKKKSLLGRIAGAVASEVKDTVSDKIGIAPDSYDCRISTDYHQNNIKSFMKPSRAWHIPAEKLDDGLRMRKIYKYYPYEGPATLVPEKTNPVDPNAVKVVVDGFTLGYVYSDDLPKIHALIKAGCFASVRVFGGPYKVVSGNNDAIEDAEQFKVKLTVMKKQ